MEEADAKIEQLSKDGKLDPAMMLTMTKAYAAAKDTDYTKEQVKDVMAHLYHKVRSPRASALLSTNWRVACTFQCCSMK